MPAPLPTALRGRLQLCVACLIVGAILWAMYCLPRYRRRPVPAVPAMLYTPLAGAHTDPSCQYPYREQEYVPE